jgi:hypothetical protein
MSKIKDNTCGLLAILDAVNELPSADTAEYEVYDGTYQVTPMVTSQTLDTSNKLMQSDVVIEKIPYAEVSNNSGGKTASIG